MIGLDKQLRKAREYAEKLASRTITTSVSLVETLTEAVAVVVAEEIKAQANKSKKRGKLYSFFARIINKLTGRKAVAA